MSNQTAFIIFNLLAVVSLGVESLLSLVPCLKGPVIELTTSTRETAGGASARRRPAGGHA